jgi:hypothetical protein
MFVSSCLSSEIPYFIAKEFLETLNKLILEDSITLDDSMRLFA